jgi:hypothetical protein
MSNNNSIASANMELFAIIKGGGPHAFGLFYNALVLSANLNSAKILRAAIDNDDIIRDDDGEELYVVRA